MNPFQPARRVVPVCLLIGGLANLTHAQSYLRYDQVPSVYTQRPQAFSALLARGMNEPLRMVMLGDSQETSPGGAGAVYVPRLNYEFYRTYGNAPATPFNAGAANTGGGQPWADWLVRTSQASPGAAPTRVPSLMLPPNMAPGAVSLLDGDNINNNQRFGVLLALEPSAEFTDPGCLLNPSVPFFDTSQGVYLDVYAATNPQSGELECRVSYGSSAPPTYFAPIAERVTTSMQLAAPSIEFRKQRLGPFEVPQGQHLQVEIGGTDAALLTDYVGASFVSAAAPRGVTISTLSTGGYRVADYLSDHALGTQLMQVYEPDAILIHYGANDAAAGYSLERFRSDMSLLLFVLRANFGTEFPIIVFSEAYSVINPDYADTRDRYAGVLYQLAQDDPFLCVVNSRRLTHDAGWDAGTSANYLADGVHYNAAGARLIARLEANALTSAFLGSCPTAEANPLPPEVQICAGMPLVLQASLTEPMSATYQWQVAGPDGVYENLQNGTLPYPGGGAAFGAGTAILTIVQLPAELDQHTLRCIITDGCGQIATTPTLLSLLDGADPACQPRVCDADVNLDGAADQGDVDYLVNVIAGGDNPSTIDPDFNQDGAADQTDVDALINVVAGGACP